MSARHARTAPSWPNRSPPITLCARPHGPCSLRPRPTRIRSRPAKPAVVAALAPRPPPPPAPKLVAEPRLVDRPSRLAPRPTDEERQKLTQLATLASLPDLVMPPRPTTRPSRPRLLAPRLPHPPRAPASAAASPRSIAPRRRGSDDGAAHRQHRQRSGPLRRRPRLVDRARVRRGPSRGSLLPPVPDRAVPDRDLLAR